MMPIVDVHIIFFKDYGYLEMFVDGANTWIVLVDKSTTYTLPGKSTAIPAGPATPSILLVDQAVIKLPLLSNF